MNSPLRVPPTATALSPNRRLAEFIVTASPPAEVRMRAVSAILDTLCVMIAGSGEPAVRSVERTLEESSGRHAVSGLWNGRRLRPEDAALLFGTASHVLDYDDVSMLTVCHPSAPVLSALLSVAGETPGAALVDAFAIGTEVLNRVGEAMGFRHYALGFHATATLGAIGAAAACARLLALDAMQTRHALAIAASLAGGLRKNFGSMVKSLHVGFAATNGVRAARLAAAGIVGAEEPFDGEGFFHAMSGGETDRLPAGAAFGQPYALVTPGFEQKRYPCCYMLHKMIEATLAWRRESGCVLDDVARIRVILPVGGSKPLIHPCPRSGLNALFSAPYAVLAALEDGRIDLASFTDSAVLRPKIQARLPDVEVIEAGERLEHGADIGKAPVTVSFRLQTGTSQDRAVRISPGSSEDPLTSEQALAKWLDCLRRGLPQIEDAASAHLFTRGQMLLDMPDVQDWLGSFKDAGGRP